MKNYWIPKIEASIGTLENLVKNADGISKNEQGIIKELNLILNEFKELPTKEIEQLKGVDLNLEPSQLTIEKINTLRDFSEILRNYYLRMTQKYSNEKDNITHNLNKNLGGGSAFLKFKSENENAQLLDFMNNKSEIKKIIELDGELLRNENLVYLHPEEGINHFYTSKKSLFGNLISTFWYNLIVLWLTTLSLIVTLYFNLFGKLINASIFQVSKPKE